MKNGTILALMASGLMGCMSDAGGDTGGGLVSMFKPADQKTEIATKNAETPKPKNADNSLIIDGLQSRRSVLKRGSAYAQVADAVLAANSRAAEAELRGARLRAQAASKNWLPSIGPNISLSSLGDLVASLIIEQVLFDNGRKKAERAFAKADVEVAAVTLSEDTNNRVYEGLALYLAAEEGREKVRLADVALKDMRHFEWVMNERVQGGVSNMSDLNITRHKLAEMESARAAAAEQTNAALAELGAMTALSVDDVRGVSAVPLREAEPLSVVLAEAEKERRIAQATMERAGHLPGLKAGGTVGKGGGGIGLSVSSDKLIGLGTGASLKAIEATKEAASRQVAEAREDANRNLRGKEQKLKALDRQAAEAQALTAQAKANLDLFQAQYEAGQRQIMDVVGVYETFARQQQDQAELKYKAARLRLEMARDLGLLADGERI